MKLLTPLVAEISIKMHHRSNVPDCTRDVDQSVGTIEHCQCGLVPLHKPNLHVMLFPREQETRPAELLKFQDCQTMRLRHVYYRLIEYHLREDFRHAIEEVCDDPIEYLDQEWELL